MITFFILNRTTGADFSSSSFVVQTYFSMQIILLQIQCDKDINATSPFWGVIFYYIFGKFFLTPCISKKLPTHVILSFYLISILYFLFYLLRFMESTTLAFFKIFLLFPTINHLKKTWLAFFERKNFFLICHRISNKITSFCGEILAKFLRPAVFYPSIYSKFAINFLP